MRTRVWYWGQMKEQEIGNFMLTRGVFNFQVYER